MVLAAVHVVMLRDVVRYDAHVDREQHLRIVDFRGVVLDFVDTSD